jgi:serine/threonine protein kinase
LPGCRVPEECPKSIADICRACLQRNPKLRPSAARVMEIVDLHICLDSHVSGGMGKTLGE